jgi:uncharacterized protein
MKTVVVLGASPKPERYSNMAIQKLAAAGYSAIGVNPASPKIEGHRVVRSLADIFGEPVDTLTLYVNPAISEKSALDIQTLNPRRVIFNPGSENGALKVTLEGAGIRCIEACTLVLLSTHQFETA